MLHNRLESYPIDQIHLVDFFQLIRSIERDSGLRLGSDLSPQDEPVKLKADLDAQFPSNEVASWNDANEKPEIRVSFFGLFGPSGALPQHYTELLAQRSRINDFALRDFLDMFNHRLLTFFYRCWEKHQFPIAFETARAAGQEDRVTAALRALSGMRTHGLWNRLSLPSQDFLYYSAHFSNRRPTAHAISTMLANAFNIPVQVEQFVGQRMFIDPHQQTRLGISPLGVSLGNQLGTEAIAGQWVWDFENKFRVRIGPLGLSRFLEFNPDGIRLRQVWDFLRSFVGPQFDFDIQVVLRHDEVPMAKLESNDSSRLGWNTWIGEWNKLEDAMDPIFELQD